MSKKSVSVAVLIAAVLLAHANIALSQTEALKGGAVADIQNDPEILWLWGSVVTIDAQNKQLQIKYFDYETDVEQDISMVVDDKTTYENIQSINDLKPQDVLSVDYYVGLDGKNIARAISVEKPEEPFLPAEDLMKTEPKKN
jgi:hypothetical protein